MVISVFDPVVAGTSKEGIDIVSDSDKWSIAGGDTWRNKGIQKCFSIFDLSCIIDKGTHRA